MCVRSPRNDLVERAPLFKGMFGTKPEFGLGQKGSLRFNMLGHVSTQRITWAHMVLGSCGIYPM